jgi:hypothetical protein
MEKIFAPDRLLDRLSQELRVRSDKQLARKLGLGAEVLGQIRKRRIPVTATMLMRMQEISGVPVDTLRALMGDRRRRIRALGVSRLRQAGGGNDGPAHAPAVRRKGSPPLADSYGYRRNNHVQAAYVDAALKLRDKLGAHDTAQLLLHEGVDDEVVATVLEAPAGADA